MVDRIETFKLYLLKYSLIYDFGPMVIERSKMMSLLLHRNLWATRLVGYLQTVNLSPSHGAIRRSDRPHESPGPSSVRGETKHHAGHTGRIQTGG